jgi:hypothetical protein
MKLMFQSGRKFPADFVETLESQKIGGEEWFCGLKFENLESIDPCYREGRLWFQNALQRILKPQTPSF